MEFNGYEKGPNFDRARSQIATPFAFFDVDVSVSEKNKIVNISGDFIYIDSSSDGVLTIELNNQYSDQAAPFLANPGFAINAIFKQVKLSWDSQPGKKVRIMYSTGESVVPAFSASMNITGDVSVISDPPSKRNGNFNSISQLIANTPEMVLDPALNINGAWIIALEISAYSNQGTKISLIEKNNAPSNFLDGNILKIIQSNNVGMYSPDCISKPFFVNPGKGVYFITSASETAGYSCRNVDYYLM